MMFAEVSWRIDERIREVLDRDDLTGRQKRENANTLSVPGVYEIESSETVSIEK